MPLVALVHVAMGSFLSMQAYFGGTFVDGTGAVVGVGLIRNIAPLMTGLTLAGLYAALITAELRGQSTPVKELPPQGRPGSVFIRGITPVAPLSPEPITSHSSGARLTAIRVASSVAAGLVLTLWATGVGIVVGWQVGQTLLGVSTHAFFYMFSEMLWLRDIVGLVIKGMAFGLFASLCACHEGLWRPGGQAPQDSIAVAACRAACLSIAAMLLLNSAWFLLLYHAGPAFGPTLLAPPTQ
jgi:phospholipid/cholesterol/gamma-HCH transport system permease protein